jgi:GT2 family glycosyltransferase
MPELSIIIVSYNTREVLAKCLASVFAHAPRRSYEVVVVDNASEDGSPEMVRADFPKVRLLPKDRNLGFGPANNLGVKSTEGALLLMQNSDLLALPGLYDGALDYLGDRPRIGVLGPRLVGPDGELRQLSWGWKLNLLGEMKARRFSPSRIQESEKVRRRVEKMQTRIRSVDVVAGACMFVRRAVFDDIGLFDEKLLFYLEESDLCLRARQAGWKVVFHPGLNATHLLGASQGENYPRTLQIYRQSQMHFYRKHFGRLQRWLLRRYLTRKFRRLFRNARTEDERTYYREMIEIVRGERTVDFTSSQRIEKA